VLTDFWDHLKSTEFSREATWACIYALPVFGLVTAAFMLKIGAKLLIDWAYAWVMVALAMWVTRIIYIVKINPQPIGTSIWSLFFALHLLVAMAFAMVLVVRTGYRLFHQREYR
jgi:hypothetical protein